MKNRYLYLSFCLLIFSFFISNSWALDPDVDKIDTKQSDGWNINKEDQLKTCESQKPETYKPAIRHEEVPCPHGYRYFSDPDGYCWQCPGGYDRTMEPVTSDKACSQEKRSAATRHGKATWWGKCPSGQFLDIGNGYCWSCPGGYHRSGHPVTSGSACIGDELSYKKAEKGPANNCPGRSEDQFEDLGVCWSCPKNYVRTAFPVNGDKACVIKVDKACFPEPQYLANVQYGWHVGAGHGGGSIQSLDAVDNAAQHHDSHTYLLEDGTEKKFEDACDNNCAFKKLLDGLEVPDWERGRNAFGAIRNNAALRADWAACGCGD